MALQLSPMVGAVAFQDRMGDVYPELLKSGQIVQGHSVSGSMSQNIVTAVNHDLKDPEWRSCFHEGLKSNRQFQHGVVTFALDSEGRSTGPTDPHALQKLQQPEWEFRPFDVETIRKLSGKSLSEKESNQFEYGSALIKTAASLAYTMHLCHQLHLVAATDSLFHYRLLERTCHRDNVALTNTYVQREGY